MAALRRESGRFVAPVKAALGLALLLCSVCSAAAASFNTQARRWRSPRRRGKPGGQTRLSSLLPLPCPASQWSLGLPWTDTIASFPGAVFGDDLLVAFTGLDGRQWELVGAAIAGPDAGRVLWTAELPLGSQMPSTIAVAGELAVLELDGRVFAVDPRNGTVLWNATSPCSLGDPRMVDTRCASCLATVLAVHRAMPQGWAAQAACSWRCLPGTCCLLLSLGCSYWPNWPTLFCSHTLLYPITGRPSTLCTWCATSCRATRPSSL